MLSYCDIPLMEMSVRHMQYFIWQSWNITSYSTCCNFYKEQKQFKTSDIDHILFWPFIDDVPLIWKTRNKSRINVCLVAILYRKSLSLFILYTGCFLLDSKLKCDIFPSLTHSLTQLLTTSWLCYWPNLHTLVIIIATLQDQYKASCYRPFHSLYGEDLSKTGNYWGQHKLLNLSIYQVNYITPKW